MLAATYHHHHQGTPPASRCPEPDANGPAKAPWLGCASTEGRYLLLLLLCCAGARASAGRAASWLARKREGSFVCACGGQAKMDTRPPRRCSSVARFFADALFTRETCVHAGYMQWVGDGKPGAPFRRPTSVRPQPAGRQPQRPTRRLPPHGGPAPTATTQFSPAPAPTSCAARQTEAVLVRVCAAE